MSKETTSFSKVQPTNDSLLARMENLSLNLRKVDSRPSSNDLTTNENDISYFNRLMADIVAMNYVRANDPASLTSAHLLLIEEANLVWSRLCASGIINSPEALHKGLARSELAELSTPKRARAPSNEGGDAAKWESISPPKHSSPSSRKFFQWSSLNGSKSAEESPNWRADAKDNKSKSTSEAMASPKKETTFKPETNRSEASTIKNGSRMASMDIAKSFFVNMADSNEVKGDSPHIFKLEKKIFIPDHPGYNFIGRILGPRGISIRQLEAATQCGILIRGKGSVKDPEKEKRLIEKSGYEHLQEQLHVHITAMGSNLAQCQEHLNQAVAVIESLLTPSYDEYKKTQLIHLAIINGTYRAPTTNAEKSNENSKNGF